MHKRVVHLIAFVCVCVCDHLPHISIHVIVRSGLFQNITIKTWPSLEIVMLIVWLIMGLR